MLNPAETAMATLFPTLLLAVITASNANTSCPPLPPDAPRMVGVLVGPVTEELLENGLGGDDEYALGIRGRYTWAHILLETEGGGGSAVISPDPNGPEPLRFDNLASLTPDIARQLGIRRQAVLVQYTANCGKAPPDEPSAVLTDLRILDGTAEYPLVTANVLSGLMRLQQEWVTSHWAEVDEEFRRNVSRTARYGPLAPSETRVLKWMWWEDDRLFVRLKTRVQVIAMGGSCGYQLPDGERCNNPAGEAVAEVEETWTINRRGVIESHNPSAWKTWSADYPEHP